MKNYTIIKSQRTYTINEISESLEVHKRTVNLWTKKGLPILDRTSKPYLILGSDLKHFLKTKKEKRRCPLNVNEFYCLKCRTAVKDIISKRNLIQTNKRLGENAFQVVFRSTCSKCKNTVNRFSSSKNISNAFNDMNFEEVERVLI